MITIKLPITLKDYNTNDFLASTEKMFDHVGLMTEHFVFRTDKVKSISLFSQLLLYKFINYSATHMCFKNPNVVFSDYIRTELKKSGFWELIESHLKNKRIAEETFKRYETHYISKKGMFFIAPMKLLRTDAIKHKHISAFTKQVSEFYSYNDKIISLISMCLCEIYMNFWEHATEDSGTIMVAQGDKKLIQIMFADNGEGILTNLRNAGVSGKNLLEQAIKRGITSKKGTDHMGWGLWLVSQLCKCNTGMLEIYSEGEALIINKGHVNTKQCGYWKGTIIHLRLPIDNPKLISDLRLPELKPSIKINWS